MKFRGTYTALVTPFRDGRIDERAFRRLIAAQVAAGVEGIVPCGSTGESATLSHAEHERVIAIAIEEAAGRIRVMAGTGSNNTAEARSLTRTAAKAGADAALLISPYYNKPTQRGHVEHYRAIAEAVELPLVVYNIPGRTGVNMLPDTIAALAEIPGIVGIKEAAGSVDQVLKILQLVPDDFAVLSGDDTMTVAFMAIGGHGAIAVASNLVPERYKAMVDAAARDDFAAARAIQRELLPVMHALALETNPIPIKTALAMAGHMTDELRLPLTAMESGNRARLEAVLREAGLLAR